MIVRPLRKKDIMDIQRLALKSWLFTYKKIYSTQSIRKQVANYYSDKSFTDSLLKIKKKKEYFVVACEKDAIIGYAHIGKNGPFWELLRIYVDPKILGHGIGSRLIKSCEIFLISKNIKKYMAYPHIRNPIAMNFYKKQGFVHNLKYDHGKNSPCYMKQL